MQEKKQGRRSAKEAQATKQQILSVATDLFCSDGYKKVSLRQISEQAGVSHGLIRYHFGSKEKIWQQISDMIYQCFSRYFDLLFSALPPKLPANVQLYKITTRLLARNLDDPRANQFLADALNQDKEMINYFLDPRVETSPKLNEIIKSFKSEYPNSPVTMARLKWQSMIYSHAAITLQPLMKSVFNQDSLQEQRLAHWMMFNEMMASQFHIQPKDIDRPQTLSELILKNTSHSDAILPD